MMSDAAIWKAVDHYIVESLIPEDPILESVLKTNKTNWLPDIDVSPAQGALLNLLVRISGAKKILEIGTLGGYSTIWMARALPPGGKVVTIEFQPRHAKVARQNVARAGLADVVDVREGKALDLLPGVEADGLGPFDLIFIDADKPSNPQYLEWAEKLGRPGTIVIVDNVIRDGEVIQAHSENDSVHGARAAFTSLGGNSRFTATAVQTVGSKGYDGFAIAVMN
jgi:predicted O-methyltransferase YrrM